jgi:hypothetical protein
MLWGWDVLCGRGFERLSNLWSGIFRGWIWHCVLGWGRSVLVVGSFAEYYVIVCECHVSDDYIRDDTDNNNNPHNDFATDNNNNPHNDYATDNNNNLHNDYASNNNVIYHAVVVCG